MTQALPCPVGLPLGMGPGECWAILVEDTPISPLRLFTKWPKRGGHVVSVARLRYPQTLKAAPRALRQGASLDP